METFRMFAGVVELLILVGSGVALLWFVWRVFLRKLWRVRRIENARLKRILAERRSGMEEDGD
jgi:hypothetical protein